MADMSALHVAMSGLRAAQVAMDTASHNVANANTPGYTRQRVDLASNHPRSSQVGQIGTGVSVTDVSRVRDNFLDVRFRSSVSSHAGSRSRSELLTRAELVLAEPELGISAELTGLWDSFEDLSLDPPDEASRIAVLEQLGSLTGRVNHVALELDALQDDAAIDIAAGIADLDQALRQIAELNVAILDASATSTAGRPNDLMDQRDTLLDRVAELAGATATVEDDGSARVSIGGVTLVAAGSVRTLAYDSGTGVIVHASGVEVTPGGEIGGLQATIANDLTDLMAGLDAFAVELADTINGVHAGGFTAAGAAGPPLLSFSPGNPAASLAVAVTDPSDLASAASAGPPYPEFDGTTFAALADLRSAPGGGGASLGDVYRAFVTGLGQLTASARTSRSTQAGLKEAADLARASHHGVSVDEELVHLMEFQRMYEAAARVVTTVDQALDTVINRMGIVGR